MLTRDECGSTRNYVVYLIAKAADLTVASVLFIPLLPILLVGSASERALAAAEWALSQLDALRHWLSARIIACMGVFMDAQDKPASTAKENSK